MLRSLSIRNFTAFSKADFQFAPGLNVLIGENGTGKSHVLKVAYSVISACARPAGELTPANPTKSFLQSAIAERLTGVLRPDRLGRLARRSKPGKQRSEVACSFSDPELEVALSVHTASVSEVVIDKSPAEWIPQAPIYLPTRELLTIYPGFVSLYDERHLPFERTWRDTCALLGRSLLKGARQAEVRRLMEPLEAVMGGTVLVNEAGSFYLNQNGVAVEMHLVAEGLRKLATIAFLIANGSLTKKSYLFWDEPEANLNPKIIEVIARTILQLARGGVQIFIASHSLFLVRELDILLRSEFSNVSSRFFGLHPGYDGVSVAQGDSADDIGSIDALDEELRQSDRYLEAAVA